MADRPMTLSRIVRGLWWRICGKWLVKLRQQQDVRRHAYRKFPIVRDLGAISPKRGRAILLYVVDPFVPGADPSNLRSHVHHWRSAEMVTLLGEAGFSVDVTDWRNLNTPVAEAYDLVIGLGKAFEKICRRNKVFCIYLGTGRYSEYTAKAVKARTKLLRARQGVTVNEPCSIERGPLYANEVWYFGDDATRDSYRAITRAPLYPLPNTVVRGVRPTLAGKNFSEAACHFMWMASHGPLLRCLDILLEIFELMPKCHLWICGNVAQEKQFFEFYRRQLVDVLNIHYVGWVDVAGEKYEDITRRCGYIIHPSVSDGMPGSVVNAMAAGVVPIFTDEAGIDCGGYGFRIASVEHRVLRELILQAASIDPGALETQAIGTSSFSWRRYSEDAFRTAFRQRVDAVADRLRS